MNRDFNYWCQKQRQRIREQHQRDWNKARGLNARGQPYQHSDEGDLTGVPEALLPHELTVEVRR